MGFTRHYGTAQLPLQIDNAKQGTIVPYFFRVEAPGDPVEIDPDEMTNFVKTVNGIVDRYRSTALVGSTRATVKRAFDELCELLPDRHIIAEGIDMYLEQTAIGAEVRAVMAEGVIQRLMKDMEERRPYIKMLLEEIAAEAKSRDQQ